MKRLLPLLSFAPLLLVTMGAGPCDSQPLGNVDGGTSCTYQGKTYSPGASVPSTDKCNTCSCMSDGQVGCTLKACTCVDANGKSVPCTPPDGGIADAGTSDGGGADTQHMCYDNNANRVPCPTDGGTVTCDYLGKVVPVGTSFPSADGCNTCSCQTTGDVLCTLRACFDAGVDAPTTCDYAGVRYNAGATFPSTDGCNTCSCTATGVACSKSVCGVDAGSTDGKVITGVCKPGLDQLCNEDPVAAALRGKCQPDGSCLCAGSGTSGVVSPYTGKCLGPGDTTGDGCEYGGKLMPVGSSFTCADGCNTCTCTAPGSIRTTDAVCADGGTPSMCGLDSVYEYGTLGGRVVYRDEVTLAPSVASPTTTATYLLTRSDDKASSVLSCAPPFPTCGSATALDVSDIMIDILDPVVQKSLSPKGTTLLLGLDTRPIDGPIFSFMRGDGYGFLIGAPCNGAAGCNEIPPAVAKLVADLRALDQQQLQSPACAALVAAPPKP
jgi:hypothetical protein